jgi:hypothetical protein
MDHSASAATFRPEGPGIARPCGLSPDKSPILPERPDHNSIIWIDFADELQASVAIDPLADRRAYKGRESRQDYVSCAPRPSGVGSAVEIAPKP